MEYLNFSPNKSQFGRSNESPWSHALTLRGHDVFSIVLWFPVWFTQD